MAASGSTPATTRRLCGRWSPRSTRGYPPSQAAKLALAGTTAAASSEPADPERGRAELVRALQRYDGARAHALLDSALSELSLNAVLRDLVLPCLTAIGDAWARGELTIAEEHFASQLIRERLLGLARDWDQGRGPRALLACPAGERHDIALICFGLVLSRSGWRITFLGPDTPANALTEVVNELAPDLVVLAATVADRFRSIAEPLRALAARHPLALAGPGATPDVARVTGTTLLEDGPVAAALQLAAHPPRIAQSGD